MGRHSIRCMATITALLAIASISSGAFGAAGVMGVVWDVVLPGPVHADPIVDGQGNLYIPSGHRLLSLDSKGIMRWDLGLDGPAISLGLAPEGAIYAGTSTGKVHSISQTGAILWSKPLKAVGGIGFTADGLTVIGGSNGLHALASDSREVWRYEVLPDCYT